MINIYKMIFLILFNKKIYYKYQNEVKYIYYY